MRVQLIELHEQPWVPSTIRDEIMEAMQFGLRLLKVYAPVAPTIRNLLGSTGSRCIVDLCSGAGGPWFDLAPRLGRKGAGIDILLTDIYPNLGAFPVCGNIRFYPKPVDASNIPPSLSGLRTMFSSFHHFPPHKARAILQNAVNAGEGIGIFEVTKRDPFTILLMLPWSLMPFLFTPWVRPFRWSRLLWTYVVPLIPSVLLFDGIVSCLRTYHLHELREIVQQIHSESYKWEIEQLPRRCPYGRISYVTGYPKAKLS